MFILTSAIIYWRDESIIWYVFNECLEKNDLATVASLYIATWIFEGNYLLGAITAVIKEIIDKIEKWKETESALLYISVFLFCSIIVLIDFLRVLGYGEAVHTCFIWIIAIMTGAYKYIIVCARFKAQGIEASIWKKIWYWLTRR